MFSSYYPLHLTLLLVGDSVLRACSSALCKPGSQDFVTEVLSALDALLCI